MGINPISRQAIKAVLNAIFERAKARLLGRKSNAIYFQIVKDFGIEKSIEGVANHTSTLRFGKPIKLHEDTLDTHADEVTALMDALKERSTSNMFDAIKSGDTKIIKETFDKTTKHLNMIISEEVNKSKGLSLLEGIDAVNRSAGVEDPILFSVGKIDNKICKWCVKMYHCKSNIMIPRVYRRSQFRDSYFKPKEWDGKTIHYSAHPRCRHSLTTLMPGFGFDANGKVVYKGKDHDEYAIQKARGDTE